MDTALFVKEGELVKMGLQSIRIEINRTKEVTKIHTTKDGKHSTTVIVPDISTDAIKSIVNLMYLCGALTERQRKRLTNILMRNYLIIDSYKNIDVPILEFNQLLQNL